MKIAAFQWVIRDQLVRGKRPGFSGRNARPVAKETVDEWIKTVKIRFGIRSIICLLDDNHLRLYSQIQGGLIKYYRSKGFQAVLIRARNRRRITQSHLVTIYRMFQLAKGPVLVHCSAGRGRTAKAVTYIRTCLKTVEKERVLSR